MNPEKPPTVLVVDEPRHIDVAREPGYAIAARDSSAVDVPEGAPITQEMADHIVALLVATRSTPGDADALETALRNAIAPFIGKPHTNATRQAVAKVLIDRVKAQETKPRKAPIVRYAANVARLHFREDKRSKHPVPNLEREQAASDKRTRKAQRLEALAARGGMRKA